MTTFAFDFDHVRQLANDLHAGAQGTTPALPALPDDATIGHFTQALGTAVRNVQDRTTSLRADAAAAADFSFRMLDDATRIETDLTSAFDQAVRA